MSKNGSPAKSKTPKKTPPAVLHSNVLPEVSSIPFENLPPLPAPPSVSLSQMSISDLDLPPLPPIASALSPVAAEHQSASVKSGSSTSPSLLAESDSYLSSLPPPPELPPVPLAAAHQLSALKDEAVFFTSAAAAASSNRDSVPPQLRTLSPAVSKPLEVQPSHVSAPVDEPSNAVTTPLPSRTNATSRDAASVSSPASAQTQENRASFRLMTPDSTSPVNCDASASAADCFSGSVGSVLHRLKCDQLALAQVWRARARRSVVPHNALQLIKDKEDALTQVIASTNALVAKERAFISDLNRSRRLRNERIAEIRSVQRSSCE
jgi:hypothetical protein